MVEQRRWGGGKHPRRVDGVAGQRLADQRVGLLVPVPSEEETAASVDCKLGGCCTHRHGSSFITLLRPLVLECCTYTIYQTKAAVCCRVGCLRVHRGRQTRVRAVGSG